MRAQTRPGHRKLGIPKVPLGIRIISLWTIASLSVMCVLGLLALLGGADGRMEVAASVVISGLMVVLSVFLYGGSLLAARILLVLMALAVVRTLVFWASASAEDWVSVGFNLVIGVYLVTRLPALRVIATARKQRQERYAAREPASAP